MLEVLLHALALAASLALLVWSSDVFIAAAEAIGVRAGLSGFVIGVTIVALGTSFPELVSSVTAVLLGASEIAVGTAVGSNVANILLVLAASAIAGGGLRVAHELVRVDLPFLFGSALLLALLAWDGSVTWPEGLLALAALAVYLAYTIREPQRTRPGTTLGAAATELSLPTAPVTARTGLALLGGLLGLQAGAWATVESVGRLAALAGLGREVLAATVVAVGTSLPELVVSLRSARAGKHELAVGNVIGSNVFNALGVVGVASLCGTLAVPPSMLGFALPAMVAATVLCFFVLQEREVTRWDGWLLLILYAAFALELVGVG